MPNISHLTLCRRCQIKSRKTITTHWFQRIFQDGEPIIPQLSPLTLTSWGNASQFNSPFPREITLLIWEPKHKRFGEADDSWKFNTETTTSRSMHWRQSLPELVLFLKKRFCFISLLIFEWNLGMTRLFPRPARGVGWGGFNWKVHYKVNNWTFWNILGYSRTLVNNVWSNSVF